MERRWLPTADLWATKWEGFEKAKVREIRLKKRWNPRKISTEGGNIISGIEDINDVCGVYVFLNKNNYVLYIGSSKQLYTEIKNTFRRFSPSRRKCIEKICAYQVINSDEAEKFESDLLWYYTPPFNTKFHR